MWCIYILNLVSSPWIHIWCFIWIHNRNNDHEVVMLWNHSLIRPFILVNSWICSYEFYFYWSLNCIPKLVFKEKMKRLKCWIQRWYKPSNALLKQKGTENGALLVSSQQLLVSSQLCLAVPPATGQLGGYAVRLRRIITGWEGREGPFKQTMGIARSQIFRAHLQWIMKKWTREG